MTYTYDAAGNRTKIGGSFARTGIPQAIASADYNAANQQLALADKTMTYDNNGNLETLSDASGITNYMWNVRNQLIGISGPSVTASFEYDPLGRRVNKTINSNVTEFFYDNVNPVQETDGVTVLANILTGLGVDEFLTRTDVAAGTTDTLLTDALGNTIALSDSSGAIQTQYSYEPFGETTASGLSSTNPFQYTGRENDGTGLYYYRARYYHPGLQRFIREDPFNLGSVRLLKQQQLGLSRVCQRLQMQAQMLNLYSYVGNNPTNLVDPYGLFSVDVGVGVQLGIVDITCSFFSGTCSGSVTTPGAGVGGYGCVNICSEPPPPPPRKDPPLEEVPITVSVGAGRRASVSVSTDLCTFCFNVGVPFFGTPVTLGVPIF